MNRHGRMAQDYTRENLPKAFAEIEDPERFFTEAGEEIEVAIGEARAQILGDRRPEETQEEYRLRSSHSLRTAEELVLADHYLLVAEPEPEDPDPRGNPEQAAYDEALAEFNEAIEAVLKLSEQPAKQSGRRRSVLQARRTLPRRERSRSSTPTWRPSR